VSDEAENKEIEAKDDGLEDEAENELEQEEDEETNHEQTWESHFFRLSC
jgi:hypothetical protein